MAEKIKINFSKCKNELIPVIIQDYTTNDILMQGYMNHESFEKTIKDGRVCLFSRSRQELWTKGETSGNFLNVKEIFLDCDFDSILIKAEQIGSATCHTGRKSCFFYKYDIEKKEWGVVK